MPLRAMRLARVLGRHTISAKSVGLARDCFHMIRILTGPVTAQVIDLQALRDRANQQLVHEPMSTQQSARIAEPKHTIPLGI